VNIVFNSEVKLKSVMIMGGTEGSAPSKCKVYKNEEVVDIDII